MSIELGMSARDRRVLAFGVVTIGTIVGVARGLPALRQWRAGTHDAALALLDARAAAAQAERLMPRVRDSLRARAARLAAVDTSLVKGATPYAAAANLAGELEDIADSAAVRISSVQLRADSASGKAAEFTRVFVRLTGVSDVTGLASLMRAIDGGRLLIRVAELSVVQSEPNAPDAAPEALRIDVLVEGLARLDSPGAT